VVNLLLNFINLPSGMETRDGSTSLEHFQVFNLAKLKAVLCFFIRETSLKEQTRILKARLLEINNSLSITSPISELIHGCWRLHHRINLLCTKSTEFHSGLWVNTEYFDFAVFIFILYLFQFWSCQVLLKSFIHQ